MYGARDQDPALPIDHQRPVVVFNAGAISNGQQQRATEKEYKQEEGEGEGEGFSHESS